MTEKGNFGLLQLFKGISFESYIKENRPIKKTYQNGYSSYFKSLWIKIKINVSLVFLLHPCYFWAVKWWRKCSAHWRMSARESPVIGKVSRAHCCCDSTRMSPIQVSGHRKLLTCWVMALTISLQLSLLEAKFAQILLNYYNNIFI